ncbi:MAG: LysM peptidoglycan-binding domain-containing protein [Candidatus Cohnella colombiensis]|uniref:LysM peptidoglycan-binding domain-containing protein n=1 Tax=Candidatus Cohnella colombiensis TaxID=3121368 RepID=A0AA95EXN3_9BACL|nr:MAG: LysM peptidoglycan-binding domain-containing protein [Cohnella sp.]
MTDPLNGLRFDIYERVQLTEDFAAIDELEEIELIPRIQALPQEDQVLLTGHLVLTGVYRSYGAEELSQLEHWIPVEITLPQNRIHSVDELAVEIDNFDVDVLTDRSLNVTGVLALRGLQAVEEQPQVWRDDSFTVVHQTSIEQLRASEVEEDTVSHAGIEQLQDATTESFVEATSWHPTSEAYSPPELPVVEIGREEPTVLEVQLPIVQLSEEHLPEKKELKVALGGLPLDSADRIQSGVGLLSQLGEYGAKREAEQRVIEAAKKEEATLAASQNSSGSTGDELEWTRLFLSNGSQAQNFKKVRMCIVQREDTLEDIANRYKVQPRELQLHNQLREPYLSQGQVLYIP